MNGLSKCLPRAKKRVHCCYFVDNKEGLMDSYRCTICNYLYDPELGDPSNGIDPGTPFEALPDTWVCPVCGAEKSLFEKE